VTAWRRVVRVAHLGQRPETEVVDGEAAAGTVALDDQTDLLVLGAVLDGVGHELRDEQDGVVDAFRADQVLQITDAATRFAGRVRLALERNNGLGHSWSRSRYPGFALCYPRCSAVSAL
jgi:hypothetical protein